VFTTVSRVVGDEATQLLERQPDVIVPNGLSVVKSVPTLERHINVFSQFSIFTSQLLLFLNSSLLKLF
jgi:hypothetical protein